jgi:1,4-dihydroxy-6-naphthoate synthase
MMMWKRLTKKPFAANWILPNLSYHAFAYAADKYILLDAGSALGFGVGPMLICKGNAEDLKARLEAGDTSLKIGIPGKYTTANFLLSLAYPDATNKQELFSRILKRCA